MFNEHPKHVYNIALPASTANEVIEWFEIMEAKGELASSLIELVYDRIKTGNPLESPIGTINTQIEVPGPTANLAINQGDFFDSLYDWQGSSSATFKEEKEEKKVKKNRILYYRVF